MFGNGRRIGIAMSIIGPVHKAAAKRPKKNPTGPTVGSWRVIRGGSWIDTIARCSTTFRFYFYPNLKTSFVGFRLAKTAEKTVK